MLKKSALALLIASSVLTTMSFASDNIQISQKERDKHEKKEVFESRDKKIKVEKNLNESKSEQDRKSYDVAMTTIVFKLDDKVDMASNYSKLDAELRNSNDIIKSIQNYGKIVSNESLVQTVLSNTASKNVRKQTIEYVKEVTNGVPHKDFLDIISYQTFYINGLRNDDKLSLFVTAQDSELTSMSDIKIGGGSNEVTIQTPSISTVTFDQAVVLKKDEYKLLNLGSADSPVSPFTDSNTKTYKAIIVKILDQAS